MRVQSRCFAQQTYYHFNVLIAFAVAIAKAQWRIRVRASGGPSPPLFFDQTEARRAEKFHLETALSLSKGLDDRPPPFPLISRSGSGTEPCLICFRRTSFFGHGSRTKSHEAGTTINSIEIMWRKYQGNRWRTVIKDQKSRNGERFLFCLRGESQVFNRWRKRGRKKMFRLKNQPCCQQTTHSNFQGVIITPKVE